MPEYPARRQRFYVAIGRFVLAWADLELCLDLLILTIRSAQNSDQQGRSLPHQLGSKIGFARREAGKLAALHPHQAAILGWLDKIDALADTRHDYVHGAVIDYVEGRATTTVTLGRMLQPPNKPRRTPVKVTTAALNETHDQVREIADRLLDLCQELMDKKRSETSA